MSYNLVEAKEALEEAKKYLERTGDHSYNPLYQAVRELTKSVECLIKEATIGPDPRLWAGDGH